MAIAARPMFVWARAAGSIYQAELQRLLSLRLGVEWQPDRNNTREIAGFTPEVLRTFSKRTVEIEAELEATGARYESPALRMRADDEASLATRPAKDHTATPETLFGRWQAEAAEVGLEIGTGLERRVCWRDPDLRTVGFDEIARRLVDEEHGLCAHSARFAEHDVIEHVAGARRRPAVHGRDHRDRRDGSWRRIWSSGSPRPPPRRDGSRRAGRPSPNAASRTTPSVVLDRLTARAGTPIPETIVAGQLADVRVLGCRSTSGGVDVVRGGRIGADGARPRRLRQDRDGPRRRRLRHRRRPAGDRGRDHREGGRRARRCRAAGAHDRPLPLRPHRRAAAGGDGRRSSTRSPRPRPATPTTSSPPSTPAPAVSCGSSATPNRRPSVKAGGIAAEIAARADADDHPRSPADRQPATSRPRRPPRAPHPALRRRPRITAAAPRARLGTHRRHTRGHPAGDGRRRHRRHPRLRSRDHGRARRLPRPGRGPRRPDPPPTHRRRHPHRDRRSPVPDGPPIATTKPATGCCSTPATATATPRSSTAPSAPSTAVDDRGVSFRPDRGEPVRLPAGFIQGSRADGSPNVSHAWARTVDGAQGGTWDHAHLLGTAALDAYRGYTAQSRSVHPTHTWNTATLPTVDFGGRLAHDPDPDDQVAVALSRIPDTTMAAVNDPWTVDTELRQLIAAHQDILDRQPPDRRRELDHAVRQLAAARSGARHRPSRRRRRPPRPRRDRRARTAHPTRPRRTTSTRRPAAQPAGRGDRRRRARRRRPRPASSAHRANRPPTTATSNEHGWRRDAIDDARDRLDQHWTDVALACVRADQTLAYGVEPLRIGRRHLAGQLATIEASLPPDRSDERDRARTTLRTRTAATARRRTTARPTAKPRSTSNSPAAGHDATRPPSARQPTKSTPPANTSPRTERIEAEARGHLTDLNRHQKARDAALAATATERHALDRRPRPARHRPPPHPRRPRPTARRPSHPAPPRRPRAGTRRRRRPSRLVPPSKPARTPPRPRQRRRRDMASARRRPQRHTHPRPHRRSSHRDPAPPPTPTNRLGVHHRTRSRDPRRDRSNTPGRAHRGLEIELGL